VTGPEAEEQLVNESNGTFMIRMSERLDGEFVISYKWQGSVRHYLIQPDDTADKKKTLVDFLGQNLSLTHLLQMKTDVNEKRLYFKHSKDKLLAKHYKKPPKQSAKNQSLGAKPYDSQMMWFNFESNALIVMYNCKYLLQTRAHAHEIKLICTES